MTHHLSIIEEPNGDAVDWIVCCQCGFETLPYVDKGLAVERSYGLCDVEMAVLRGTIRRDNRLRRREAA